MKNFLTSPSRFRRGGMILIEVLCAILIFGMAAVSLMKALTVSAQSAVISQQELRMLLRLQSTLNEYSKYPRIEEYEGKAFETDKDDLGVWTRAEVIKIENIENFEGQPLNDMYEIIVTAYYDDFGQLGEVKANTVRYARLYSTAGAAAGGTPQLPATR
jgi:type II secretory pathway pseudopilin PulG